MQKSFIQFVKDKYEVGSTSILNNEDIDKELAELDLDE
jgi:hypothetical protein